jgi:hypothetical protein
MRACRPARADRDLLDPAGAPADFRALARVVRGRLLSPCAPITPAITVPRTRGPRALATAILQRLLPTYQPRLQAAQARERAHRDAVARQEAIAALLAQVPGCTARHTPG